MKNHVDSTMQLLPEEDVGLELELEPEPHILKRWSLSQSHIF